MFDDSERRDEIVAVEIRRHENGREWTIPRRWLCEAGDELPIEWDGVHAEFGGGQYVAIGRGEGGRIVARDAIALPGVSKPLVPGEERQQQPAPAPAPADSNAAMLQFMTLMMQQSTQQQQAAAERSDRQMQAFLQVMMKTMEVQTTNNQQFASAMAGLLTQRQQGGGDGALELLREGMRLRDEFGEDDADAEEFGELGTLNTMLESFRDYMRDKRAKQQQAQAESEAAE